jgi:drug/metabolite transporter (DMT)-like permease
MTRTPHGGGTVHGSLLAALACVLVGGSFTANSVLGAYPYAGGQALRYGLAALVLLPLVARGAAARLRTLTPRLWLRLAVLAAVGMVGFNLAVLAAERTAEPAVPGVLVGCAPVVVAVLMPLLDGRRPLRPVLYGALLVAAGAFAVQGWGRTDAAGIGWSVAALGGEVGFAVVAVPLLRPLGPKLLSAAACALAAAESAAIGLLHDGAGRLRTPTADEGAALLWQAVVVTVVGFVCWYRGVQRIGAERATLFSGLIPVSAALTAPLVGAGSYGAGQLAGSALVGAGVALGAGMPLPGRARHRRAAHREGASATGVQDDPRHQRRIVVHRNVPAAGQPDQPGPRNDVLGPDSLAARQQPVPGAPGHRHGNVGDVVPELHGEPGAQRRPETGGPTQREGLRDDGLR